VGLLEKVGLQAYSPSTGYQTTVQEEGHFELIHFSGNVSTLGDQVILNCYAQLGVYDQDQFRSMGGRVFEATAINIEFCISVYDDLILERRLEPKTGLPIINRVETITGESVVDRAQAPEPASPRPTEPTEPKTETPAPSEPVATVAPETRPIVQPTVIKRVSAATSEPSGTAVSASATSPTVVRRPSWGDAIAYSSKSKDKARLGVKTPTESDKSSANLDKVIDWPDQPDIKPGDLLQHPHFGLCKVIYVEEDNFVRVRKKNRKVVDIKLEICELKADGTQDGARLFKCSIVRR